MKLLSILAAGVAFYGGTQVLHGADGGLAIADRPLHQGVYRLVADGVESCTVVRGAARADGFFALEVAPGCDALLPGIVRATMWHEGADGTVTFDRDSGQEIAAFSVADGDGYLSYAPATPLLSLAAE